MKFSYPKYLILIPPRLSYLYRVLRIMSYSSPSWKPESNYSISALLQLSLFIMLLNFALSATIWTIIKYYYNYPLTYSSLYSMLLNNKINEWSSISCIGKIIDRSIWIAPFCMWLIVAFMAVKFSLPCTFQSLKILIMY